MTVTLTFGPDVEAGLLVKAHARGMELQEFVQEIIEHEALPCSPESDLKPRQEAVRRMIEFREKHQLDLGAPITRAMLHEEHRF